MKRIKFIALALFVGWLAASCGGGSQAEYEQRRAELQEIKRQDKAYVLATSDVKIKELVAYFEEHGTEADRLEAHYYAGSTYRDLQDTPRALEHFFKIVDAFEDGAECDSVLLRNTYSNLNCLYYGVQDYPNALEMAKKELELDIALGDVSPVSYNHVGIAYNYLDSCAIAEKYFLESLKAAKKNPKKVTNDTYPSLLYCFSVLKNYEAADQCFEMIDWKNPIPLAYFGLIAYYGNKDMTDSAEYYCKYLLEEGSLTYKYDAARHLMYMNEERNPQAALHYAMIFAHINDSLNLGKRQQLAATVNNQHKYYRDMAADQKLVADRARMQKWLIVTIFGSVVLILLGTLFYLYKKYRHARAMLEKDEQLRRTSDELADRKRQLSDFLHQMHQTELSHTAEDVVESIRQAAEGKRQMSPDEWSRLYQAIDQLHPTFADRLVHSLTSFTEQQKQVLYLLRLGLTNTQIENITNLSHTTVWRWVKKFKDVVE